MGLKLYIADYKVIIEQGRARCQKKDVRNAGRTDYVHENKRPDDKVSGTRDAILHRKTCILHKSSALLLVFERFGTKLARNSRGGVYPLAPERAKCLCRLFPIAPRTTPSFGFASKYGECQNPFNESQRNEKNVCTLALGI